MAIVGGDNLGVTADGIEMHKDFTPRHVNCRQTLVELLHRDRVRPFIQRRPIEQVTSHAPIDGALKRRGVTENKLAGAS